MSVQYSAVQTDYPVLPRQLDLSVRNLPASCMFSNTDSPPMQIWKTVRLSFYLQVLPIFYYLGCNCLNLLPKLPDALPRVVWLGIHPCHQDGCNLSSSWSSFDRLSPCFEALADNTKKKPPIEKENIKKRKEKKANILNYPSLFSIFPPLTLVSVLVIRDFSFLFFSFYFFFLRFLNFFCYYPVSWRGVGWFVHFVFFLPHLHVFCIPCAMIRYPFFSSSFCSIPLTVMHIY